MKKFTRFLAMTVLALCAFSSYAQHSACVQNIPVGAPSLADKQNLSVCREGYALIFNINTKTPLWVAESLKQEDVFGAGIRQGDFKADPAIPSKFQAKDSDYAKTGYDKGHLAAAANFSKNQKLMDESFYYTNAIPQVAENNRVIWVSLEKKVRTWLMRRGELYIVTGPVFKNGKINQTMGKSNVAVPDYIFKVILDPKTQTSIAFIVPNIGLPEKALPQYIVSVRDVEMATGLNFHSSLPQDVQEKIETKRSGMWTR